MAYEKQDIVLVRLGHRAYRDLRTTTHCALVARTFGCSRVLIMGDTDESLPITIKNMNETWGGSTAVEFPKQSAQKVLQELKNKGYYLVHMTMYGLPLNQIQEKVKQQSKLAIIVGSEKVPAWVYPLVDENCSIGNQPHSEVAALGILLYELNGHAFPKLENAKRTIVPQSHGKKVERKP